jgi:Domain of unknown function (DUF4167)
MRSSKPRSRSKNNRNRSTVGNVVNRVFDSSGPQGKVRGTPQQIIDKYNQLTRDAQLSNDRVAAENFQQHAEHYTRMLSEAMREQQERRDQQEAQQRERQQAQQARHNERRQDRSDDQPRHNGRRHERDGDQPRAGTSEQLQEQPQEQPVEQPRELPVEQPREMPAEQPREIPVEQPSEVPAEQPREIPSDPSQPSYSAEISPQPDVIDIGTESDSGLVETPEEAPKPKRVAKPRKPRVRKAAVPKADANADVNAPVQAEAEVKVAPKPRTKPEAAPAAAPEKPDTPEAAE